MMLCYFYLFIFSYHKLYWLDTVEGLAVSLCKQYVNVGFENHDAENFTNFRPIEESWSLQDRVIW